LELRHLRYFVAVAEARSLRLAAEERLNTTQPSLSRQIRDLEHEVGAPLLVRGSRGVELTPAGRIFLDHARIILSQTETAMQSARHAARPTRPCFSLGIMIGHDTTWLPAALHLLRKELPSIHVIISTQNSPQLASAISEGRIDLAFIRKDDGSPDLEFRHLIDESLRVFLPCNHRLAARSAITVQDLVGEPFLSVSGSALDISAKPPALRRVIDRYLKQCGIDIRPSHEVDNLGGVMSLIASTGAVALLPAYAETFLPGSVTTRPIDGFTPTIDLSAAYRKANPSPILKSFLAAVPQLVAEVSRLAGSVPQPASNTVAPNSNVSPT
jgi:LysR family hca operon transcriptional activator